MKSSIQSQFRANPARLSAMLQPLFPAGAVVAELREPGAAADLRPAEAECVVRAVPKRIMEFAAGRACARRALQELGVADAVLPAAADRAPVWPPGMVGSITHTERFCAAVVAPCALLTGVGIDCEVVDRVGRELWPTLCGPQESAWCAALPAAQQPAAAALVFCAKEAFYKCQYPATGEWLDFHDLRIEAEWGAPHGSFKVHAQRPISAAAHAPQPAVGQYLFHGPWVCAAVAFAAPARPP